MMFGCAAFIRLMTGVRDERARSSVERTGRRADFNSQRGSGSAERSSSPAREAEAQPAAKNAAWRAGCFAPGRRSLVRRSLGPDDPQHGFDGRCICQRPRDVRRRPRQGPGFPGSGGRQLSGAQGRPSGPTGQGALSDRGRDQKGGRRHGDGRPAGGQVQSTRHRSGGNEPAEGAAARDGGREQPGRLAAGQGCRRRQEQSRARAGSG